LAGPVVVAAVCLPESFDARGLDDSKKLSPEKRAQLATRIREGADWAVEVVEPAEIDRLNILGATLEGMRRALVSLRPAPAFAWVDGNRTPSNCPCPVEAVIKGDGHFAEIAAASILAKTTRDAIMVEWAARYPAYGFEEHFGYPTPLHLERLRQLGPCPLHRRSFAPVRNWIEPNQPCLIGLD